MAIIEEDDFLNLSTNINILALCFDPCNYEQKALDKK